MALKILSSSNIPTDLPKLTNKEWNTIGLAGLVLFLMAILQLASFSDFKGWMEQTNMAQPAAWAIGIIIAELWGAAGLFKLGLSPLFRAVSSGLALVASSFWFIQSLRLFSGSNSGDLKSSGFFGNFLLSEPGWVPVLGSTLLLFVVLYSLELFSEYYKKHSS